MPASGCEGRVCEMPPPAAAPRGCISVFVPDQLVSFERWVGAVGHARSATHVAARGVGSVESVDRHCSQFVGFFWLFVLVFFRCTSRGSSRPPTKRHHARCRGHPGNGVAGRGGWSSILLRCGCAQAKAGRAKQGRYRVDWPSTRHSRPWVTAQSADFAAPLQVVQPPAPAPAQVQEALTEEDKAAQRQKAEKRLKRKVGRAGSGAVWLICSSSSRA